MTQKTIHVVGAQETNFPWGVECRIIRALEALGHRVISTDFRKHRANLQNLLAQQADIVLVCRGENIPPELIQAIPCPTALWYAELLGTRNATDADADARRKQLAYNGPAFDYVFLHDSTGIDVCKDMGCQNVRCLATAAVDPTINKRVETEKQYDVSFIGSITPRRKVFLDAIKEKANLHIAQMWDQDEINLLYNQSKIVLNIHLSGLLNTETRLCEVLGAGAFLLTEEISMKEFLVDKKHLASFRNNAPADCIAKIEYYLAHEQEREKIAADGYSYVNANHSYVQRMKEFLTYIDPHIKKKMWHFGMGVTLDRNGKPTRYLPDFYQAVETSLKKLHSGKNGTPSPLASDHMERMVRKLRIFAAFPHVNWEDYNLQPALESFGEVIRFKWNFSDQYTPQWHRTEKAALNRRLLEAVRRTHAEKPVDVFFGYLSGRTVFPETVKAIGQLGIPTLNISLDDRTKFVGALEPTGHAGQVDIAAAFTLCWTSTLSAVKQYQSVGAKAIFLPEGANPDIYRKLDLPLDIDVSFIGQCYGKRPAMIEHLKNRGIPVQTFGRGWPSGEISVEQMVEIYNRSSINIGFAMVGDSENVYCLKGRDFEVPMSGGLYMTQCHEELAHVYETGKEIECFSTLDELTDKIRYLLVNPLEADRIRTGGYRRAQCDHTWRKRFETAFKAMNILSE